RLGDVVSPSEKIAFLQNALTDLLYRNQKNYALMDHSVDLITQSHGMIRIRDLATQTGYSRRYLDILFRERVGLSPKALASILRFQYFYQSWTQSNVPGFSKNNLYSYYNDQSHFIKEFERYTGYTPQKYASLATEFNRAFHQQ